MAFWTMKDFFEVGVTNPRISSNGRHGRLFFFLLLCGVFVVDSSHHHHVTVSVRIIAARCCAIVGRGFFAPLSSLLSKFLPLIPPSMSDLFYFSFLSSWRFLICYSAAVPLARFHFCFIFGWFCRVVLRHTKSPRSRSDVTHTQGKRYPLDESDIYDAFIMKYFGFCLFLFQTKCCPPLLLYENFQIKWHRDNIATHMLYRVEIGAIFFLRISVLYRLFLLYSGERGRTTWVYLYVRGWKGNDGERYKLARVFCIIIHHRLGNCV